MFLRAFVVVAGAAVAWLLVGVLSAQSAQRPLAQVVKPTFTQDVAPIVFAHCASCHRPNGSAPFSLLTYTDVRPRAREIANAVIRRIMPPWKPEPGHGEFRGERRLSDSEVETITRWASDPLEGDRAALPPTPTYRDTWQLGEPDLILTMPDAYMLSAAGPDRFRNFVIPINIPARRYVRAWELRPGNGKIVHHATMHFDPTRSARQLDEQDSDPGYEGLVPFSLEDPDGYFLGWTPGEQPFDSGDDIPWVLEKDSDLVLMLHLMPSGKPEMIRASLGLYFSSVPPERVPALLRLGRQDIDIPAGEKRYVIADSYTLPVDVDLYSLYPHAHYLAKEIKASATPPDGSTRSLLYIKEWDFNWQDVYHYKTPIFLPAGTTLAMEYTYDNSVGNRRNPRRPPVEVIYGKNSTDEMGDLWAQVVPRNQSQLGVLKDDFARKLLPETITGLEMMLRANPDDRGLHDEVALLYQKTNNNERAVAHFAESLRLSPESAAAQYNLGSAMLKLGEPDRAREHLQKAIQIKPDYAAAYSNLGLAFEAQHKLDDAAAEYRESIRLDPDAAGTHYNLGVVLQAQGKAGESIAEYRRALALGLTLPAAHQLLGVALASTGNITEAIEQYREAMAAAPDWPVPVLQLAWVLATARDPATRRPGEALSLAQRLVKMTSPPPPTVLDVLAASFAALGEFERAVTTAEEALKATDAASDRQLRAEIQERLNQYREHRPYVTAR